MPNLTKRGFKKPLETEAYDININNFNTDKTEEELDKLLSKDGDGKDVKVTFTEAEIDSELTSQSKLSTLFGLTKKKFNLFSQNLDNKADKQDLIANDLIKATANKTLYVATTGCDTTGDGTSAKPFSTIQKALDSLPKNLGGYIVTISVSAGTYAGFNVKGYRNGYIKIAGSANKTSANSYIISGAVALMYSDIRCALYGFKFNDSVAVDGFRYLMFFYNIIDNLDKTKDGLLIASGSEISIQTSTISNRRHGVVAVDNSIVHMWGVDGTGNDIGVNLGSSSGSAPIVFSGSCTLTGTTEYVTSYGGVYIKDGVPINAIRADGSTQLTGNFNIGENDIRSSIVGTAGGWARGFRYVDKSGNLRGGIGVYGSEDTISWLYLGVGANPYLATNSVTYDGTALRMNNNVVYHSGNFNPTTKAPAIQSGTTAPSTFVGDGVLYGVHS